MDGQSFFLLNSVKMPKYSIFSKPELVGDRTFERIVTETRIRLKLKARLVDVQFFSSVKFATGSWPNSVKMPKYIVFFRNMSLHGLEPFNGW